MEPIARVRQRGVRLGRQFITVPVAIGLYAMD